MLNKMVSIVLPYMPKKWVWMFSKRYIAGETIESAIACSNMLNRNGILVTVDLLGEFIHNLEQAGENKAAYCQIIDRFVKEQVKGNFSLKPTSFGLLIDKEACYHLIRKIVASASASKSFVRIDMEDSKCTDLEIELYLRLKEEFPFSVGLVLQAYLHRTHSDLAMMINNHHSSDSPLNFRLCKGIYLEPENMAYRDKKAVNENFLMLLDTLLNKGVYVGIATHDRYLIQEAKKKIEARQLPQSAYEFQMLYGVTPKLRDSLVSEGHTLRLYVPFGADWFGYCSRRMKENPAMVGDIVKALVIRG
jgi:proline dehydrogenase